MDHILFNHSCITEHSGFFQAFAPSEILLIELPWWFSGKESACQCRRHRFNPWSRNIPHAPEQLSLCATTIEIVV